MLTLTFRYFFGSFRMSAIELPQLGTEAFMFSYNCLSCSNWPAVPRPDCRWDDSVEAGGQRVRRRIQRLVGQELAGGALAAVRAGR